MFVGFVFAMPEVVFEAKIGDTVKAQLVSQGERRSRLSEDWGAATSSSQGKSDGFHRLVSCRMFVRVVRAPLCRVGFVRTSLLSVLRAAGDAKRQGGR